MQGSSPNKSKPRAKAVWRIYKDPDNYLASSSGRSAFWSAFFNFNLAVMGSSVLPMPYAISRTGVLVGLLTMLVVALCNDYTTCLTISAAYATGLDSFESLANWAGGPHWKVFTQVTLIALLWAPNSGGLSLMGDVAQVMIDQVQLLHSTGSTAPAAMAGQNSTLVTQPSSSDSGSSSFWAAPSANAAMDWLANGQSMMVVMTVLAVFPLSCQKHMRSLETAAAAGMVVVVGLLMVLAYGALTAGLPAVVDGQLPVWSLKVNDQLPEAFSLLGYAFYLQPLIMPMLREMPEGRTGRQAITAAVHSSLLGSSLVLYAGVGFFGAALFGASTESNVMLNRLTSSPWGTLLLNGCMLFYLAAGAAACQYPLRTSIDALLVGDHVPMTLPRSMLINAVTLGVSLCVALVTPGGAEKVYAVVGASGVCIMCYVLPVVIHMKLLHARRAKAVQRYAKEMQFKVSYGGGLDGASPADWLAASLLTPHSSATSLPDLAEAPRIRQLLPSRLSPAFIKPLQLLPGCPPWLDLILRLLLPLFVMCVGIGFSIAAMSVAFADFWGP